MNPASDSLSASSLLSMHNEQRYGVEYQPIVDITNNDIIAYESLSRFYDSGNCSVRPDLVYAALHDNPLLLFQVEYQQKLLQLENAPVTDATFVNLDQDSYFACGEGEEDNCFIELFKRYDKAPLVVELIENSEINDAKMSLAMIEIMAQNNIQTAIDDVCSHHSMISTSVLEKVQYIKFDKCVVNKKSDHNFLLLVRCLIDYARSAGKKTILEGIESNTDLDFAHTLGVDCVQGFLYADKFISIS